MKMNLLIGLAAAKLMSSAAMLLFLTLLGMAAARRIRTCILALALQSAVLAGAALAVGVLRHSTAGLLVAALLLAVKVIAIPWLLFYLVRQLEVTPRLHLALSPAQSVFAVALLIAVAFAAVHGYAQWLHATQSLLAAGVALMLSGMFLMITHRLALMQVVGLLVLENGIFLAALATTFGMPLVIEAGITFDALIGLMLMGLLAFRIREAFDHLDVSRLRRLRG